MTIRQSLVVTGLLAAAVSAFGQVRTMDLDSTRNNLQHPIDYVVATTNELPEIVDRGNGSATLLFVPGLGFSADEFSDLTDSLLKDYHCLAVTLPGMGGHPALEMPPEGTSYGKQTWTHAAVTALQSLLRKKTLTNVIVVGHWMTGTQVALNLALKEPELVSGAILLAGTARWVPADPEARKREMPLPGMIAYVDYQMAPSWFKMVTDRTWHENNFLPGDYAVNDVVAFQLWYEASLPTRATWVRYLCEFFAQDATPLVDSLPYPVLALQPSLEGCYQPAPEGDYLDAYTRAAWDGHTDNLQLQTIPDSRLFIWKDNPEATLTAIREYARNRTQ